MEHPRAENADQLRKLIEKEAHAIFGKLARVASRVARALIETLQ